MTYYGNKQINQRKILFKTILFYIRIFCNFYKSLGATASLDWSMSFLTKVLNDFKVSFRCNYCDYIFVTINAGFL